MILDHQVIIGDMMFYTEDKLLVGGTLELIPENPLKEYQSVIKIMDRDLTALNHRNL